jgi:hypothetical protein
MLTDASSLPRFRDGKEIVVRSNDVTKRDDGAVSDRTTNWIVAAVKARVANQSLRGAQETILDDPLPTGSISNS